MPRLPLLSNEQLPRTELVQSIMARRGGSLLALDRLLLHSPPIAHGWNVLMGNIRSELVLSSRLLELAICAVAVLNGAEYEFAHHSGPFLQAGGTQEQLAALRASRGSPTELAASGLFDDQERAVLNFVVASTRHVQVEDGTFKEARRAVGEDRSMFELVTTVAAYNMVARILEACELHYD